MSNTPNPTPLNRNIPLLSEIRRKTEATFGKRPCLLQVKVCEALLRGDKNVVCSAATGFGKTLTFFMPLLFREDGIVIIVTALNILGTQNVEQLKAVGINGVSITAKTATKENFQDIKNGKYRVVVVNPEMLMKSRGDFEKLWDDKNFTSKLITVACDEAHCITSWGGFRSQYRELGQLQYYLPHVPFYITSATLSFRILADIEKVLHLRKDNTVYFHRSNDRSNVFLGVRPLNHTAKSFKDLDFLIPKGWKPGDPIPPKFLIFFDNIKECEKAAKHLRRRLPKEYRDKIKWFHATMSEEFREDEVKAMLENEDWGLCVTDSFGMGVDIPDIELIIQWRTTCDMDTLQQRFGRAARSPDKEARAILLVDPKYTDEEKKAKEERKRKRKRKNAKEKSSNKRQRTIGDLEQGNIPQIPPLLEAETQYPTALQPAVNSIPPHAESVANASSFQPLPEHTSNERNESYDSAEESEPEADLDFLGLEVGATVHAFDSGERNGGVDGERIEELTTEQPEPEESSAKTTESGRKVLGQISGKQRTYSVEDDPVMDDFINAGSKDRTGLGCRRVVVRKYTDKGKILVDDSMECHPPHGCSRCQPRPSRLCCDLCNSDQFWAHPVFSNLSAKSTTNSRKKSSTGRSVIQKYEPTMDDIKLRDLLYGWRDRKAEEVLPPAHYTSFGPDIFMTDIILERIIDCAHKDKISTNGDLAKETCWRRTEEYGAEIIAMIRSVRPVVPSTPFTSSPLPAREPFQQIEPQPAFLPGVAGSLAPPKQRRQVQCSVCKRVGHNGVYHY
ncbi:P-loop containing nucleoside triphosphate hydrolase protein [Schizopora paradoxa]|uniref:DNA 3'-5' helicase n=1 Tax=Schizopora paradoxa TaxID=27342 RepID=A0A0H2SH83_9AGAM|nr:P-loop containing nucleoside triphosphate hydrolase protein [Schizopora paradoxa]